MHVTAAFVLAAILKCCLSANLYRLPPIFAGDGRGSSGIGRGKSIGLTEGILLPAEAVDSNRSHPWCLNTCVSVRLASLISGYWQHYVILGWAAYEF